MVERETASPWLWELRGTGSGSMVPSGATAPESVRNGIDRSEHVVQFYDADECLVDAVAPFIDTALRGDEAVVIIVTSAHRTAIEHRLRTNDLDLDAARDSGQYAALDVAMILPHVIVDGMPQPKAFDQIIGGIIGQATEHGRRVRVFGEMVSVLALAGNHLAAIRMEELWNDLQSRHSFVLFCAYPMACLSGAELTGVFGEVCRQHARVIPGESYTALPTPDDRFRAIVQWQQKARSLEAALAAELAARRAAEEALRVREEFLSIASHELKTPLTTLSGHTQLALRQLRRDGNLEPERVVRSLETIREQTGKLSRLITQLLDVSRLDTGKLVLDRVPTDVTGLVVRTVSAVRVLSERHTIIEVVSAALDARVDPLRLEQVLTNLLDNAVKYSPEGGQVDVVLVREGSDTMELSVRDHGPGIPADKRARLFERYYQAHSDGRQGGMGLGLYISRQIVELHGGSIRAEFPPDGGTRVVVRLPIQ